jgi:hypothetical protein
MNLGEAIPPFNVQQEDTMSTTLGLFSGTLQQDPITGRFLSRRCWNTLHQPQEPNSKPHPTCDECGCECACHDYEG